MTPLRRFVFSVTFTVTFIFSLLSVDVLARFLERKINAEENPDFSYDNFKRWHTSQGCRNPYVHTVKCTGVDDEFSLCIIAVTRLPTNDMQIDLDKLVNGTQALCPTYYKGDCR